jgi:hypothetical protein
VLCSRCGSAAAPPAADAIGHEAWPGSAPPSLPAVVDPVAVPHVHAWTYGVVRARLGPADCRVYALRAVAAGVVVAREAPQYLAREGDTGAEALAAALDMPVQARGPVSGVCLCVGLGVGVPPPPLPVFSCWHRRACGLLCRCGSPWGCSSRPCTATPA